MVLSQNCRRSQRATVARNDSGGGRLQPRQRQQREIVDACAAGGCMGAWGRLGTVVPAHRRLPAAPRSGAGDGRRRGVQGRRTYPPQEFLAVAQPPWRLPGIGVAPFVAVGRAWLACPSHSAWGIALLLVCPHWRPPQSSTASLHPPPWPVTEDAALSYVSVDVGGFFGLLPLAVATAAVAHCDGGAGSGGGGASRPLRRREDGVAPLRRLRRRRRPLHSRRCRRPRCCCCRAPHLPAGTSAAAAAASAGPIRPSRSARPAAATVGVMAVAERRRIRKRGHSAVPSRAIVRLPRQDHVNPLARWGRGARRRHRWRSKDAAARATVILGHGGPSSFSAGPSPPGGRGGGSQW